MIRKATLSVFAVLLVFVFQFNAFADTVYVFGDANSDLATATVTCEFNSQTNNLIFTVENTSPYYARITSLGFDLPPGGNGNKSSGLNGFSGDATIQPLDTDFQFSDGTLGNVPGFKGSVLDFGFLTGKNFSGGNPDFGLAPGDSATFTVSGAAFAGMTESQICSSIYVRFQDVGADAEGSDVGVAATGASITIIKDTQPDSTDWFEFTATGQVDQPFGLRDTGVVGPDRIMFSSLTAFGAANPVVITETGSAGYRLVSISCTSDPNGGSGVNNNTISVPGRYASIVLEPGESVVCTFTNAILN